VLAVALPAVATSLVQFIKVSGDTFNDTLAILTATLALVLSILIIRQGPSWRYVSWLAVVCLAGMSSRASFISSLGLAFVAIALGAYFHGTQSFRKKTIDVAKKCLVVFAVVLIGIGWFYYRNYRLSGHWHRTAPQSWVADFQGRQYKSLEHVLKSKALRYLLPRRLYGDTPFESFSGQMVSTSVLIICGVGFIYTAIRKRKKSSINKVNIAVVGILVLQFILVYGQQVSHATGYGAYSPRYLLPALLPIALVLTLGALAIPKLRAMPVVALTALGFVMTIFNSMWFIANRSSIVADNTWQGLIFFMTDRFMLPLWLIVALLAGIVVGLIIQTLAFWRLTAPAQKGN